MKCKWRASLKFNYSFFFSQVSCKEKVWRTRYIKFTFYSCFESRNLHCKPSKLREVISDQAVLDSHEGPNTGHESSPWKDRWLQAREPIQAEGNWGKLSSKARGKQDRVLPLFKRVYRLVVKINLNLSTVLERLLKYSSKQVEN